MVFSLTLPIIFWVGNQFRVVSYCDTGLFFEKVYQKLWSNTYVDLQFFANNIKLRLLITQSSERMNSIDVQHYQLIIEGPSASSFISIVEELRNQNLTFRLG